MATAVVVTFAAGSRAGLQQFLVSPGFAGVAAGAAALITAASAWFAASRAMYSAALDRERQREADTHARTWPTLEKAIDLSLQTEDKLRSSVGVAILEQLLTEAGTGAHEKRVTSTVVEYLTERKDDLDFPGPRADTGGNWWRRRRGGRR